MRSLVLGDIHNRIYFVDDLIRLLNPDEIIFLGDYFDQFNDTAADALRTARWVKARLYLRNYHFLLGNHDINYRWPKCPWHMNKAYDAAKQKAIDSVLTKEDWARMLFAVERGNWWMTHAGLHPQLFPPHPIYGLQSQKVWDIFHEAEFKCEAGLYTQITDEPTDPERPSGPLWLRWDRFKPILGINQIVGHTRRDEPGIIQEEDSINYNLDTNSRHYGILEDGKLSVHENPFWVDQSPREEVEPEMVPA